MKIPRTRILMLAASLVLAAMPLAAQGQRWVPYTGVKQTGFTVTPPVKSMPKASPHGGPPVQVPLLHRPSFVPTPPKPSAPDPALQTASGATLSAVSGAGFGGVGFNGYYPPDPNISVGGLNPATGHEEVVQTTNVEFAVYDAATGETLSGPTAIDSLFSSLSGTLCASNNGGDPIVLWDKITHRWLISQLAYKMNLRNDQVCIAISNTADATGTYNAYAFTFTNLPDYPKFGVWSPSSATEGPNGTSGTSDYYFSANLFSMSRYYGPLVCAFNGADMQSGAPTPRFACSQGPTSNFSLLPSDSDGATPPATGEQNYFVELGNSHSLIMYPFLATWTSTSGSLNNPNAINIPVDTYMLPCSGGGTCIPQPGTNNQLDSLGDRLMYRLAFRKSSNGESLVVNHSVDEGNGVVGIRWYEFKAPTTFEAFESSGTFDSTHGGTTYQGTFGTDGNYRWMGSIAQDKVGDLALGYSESNGNSLFPSIYYTGTTAPNSATMDTEVPIVNGTGAETGANRWGDYSSLSVDPADDCTFWYTNEYFNANASSSVSWSTDIAPFNFTTCPTFDLSSTSSSATVSAGSSATYTVDVASGAGYSGTIGLTAENPSSGLNTGDVTFSNGAVDLSGGGSQTVNVSVDTTGLASGTYTFYVVGEDSSAKNGGGALAKGLPLTLTVTSGSSGTTITVSSLTLNPTTVTAGTSSTGTVTLSAAPSSNVSVTLTSSNTSVAQVTSPATVLAGHTSASFSVMTGSTTGTATIKGSYNNSSASDTLTVNPASSSGGTFTVAATPTSQTVNPGQNTTYTVAVTSNNGFSGSVNLSVSALPKFVHASFATNPVSVSGSGTSTTLTVRTNKNVAPSPSGGYPLTITGTSGSQSSSATVYLIVQ